MIVGGRVKGNECMRQPLNHCCVAVHRCLYKAVEATIRGNRGEGVKALMRLASGLSGSLGIQGHPVACHSNRSSQPAAVLSCADGGSKQ